MKSRSNKIFFLGTGGGHEMLVSQKLSTAGTWLNIEGVNIFLDPGPGAISKIHEYRLNPRRLEAVLITHQHLDHASDLAALAECIGSFQRKSEKKVFLPADVLLSQFHQKAYPGLFTFLSPKKKYYIKNLTIETTGQLIEKPFYHKNLLEFGFLIKSKKLSVLALPETYFTEEIFFKNKAKVLLINAMKEEKRDYDELVKNIRYVNPKITLVSHWMLSLYQKGIKDFAKRVAREAGSKVVAAKDGYYFDLMTNSLHKIN